MARPLRNVTIRLEEEVARWARVYAAEHDTSLSRLLGEMLRDRMEGEEAYAAALKRALRRKPFLKSDGRYPSRAGLQDRSGFR